MREGVFRGFVAALRLRYQMEQKVKENDKFESILPPQQSLICRFGALGGLQRGHETSQFHTFCGQIRPKKELFVVKYRHFVENHHK